MTSFAEVEDWDRADPLADKRATFVLPQGVIYLDGNSLGPLSRHAQETLNTTITSQWGDRLIRNWNEGWMQAPTRIGGKIATLIGAAANEVVVADSTSVNLFKLLAAAVALRPGRRKLLLAANDFPTDRHVAAGLARLCHGLEIHAIAETEPGSDASSLAAAIDSETAVVLACDVHYCTGARRDMSALSAAAARAGALTVWDISHSVGGVAVELNASGADFATGCGYKFLNGGPGAPAFIFAAQRHHAVMTNPLQGWIGHADPFSFSDIFAPAPGIPRLLTGTPPILGLAALEAGVDGFLATDQAALWQKSARLFDLFAERAGAVCPALELLTPTDAAARGSHISFRHARAQAVMAALIARGVIGDYRPPDILRFGLTPLYLTYAEVWQAVEVLADALAKHG